MPDNREEKYTRADRDLLIKVDTKLDAVINNVKELKDNLVHKVSCLENDKVDKKDLDKVLKEREEKWTRIDNHLEILAKDKANREEIPTLTGRVNALENWRWWILGMFSVMGVVIALTTYIYMNDMDRMQVNIDRCLEDMIENQ